MPLCLGVFPDSQLQSVTRGTRCRIALQPRPPFRRQMLYRFVVREVGMGVCVYVIPPLLVLYVASVMADGDRRWFSGRQSMVQDVCVSRHCSHLYHVLLYKFMQSHASSQSHSLQSDIDAEFSACVYAKHGRPKSDGNVAGNVVFTYGHTSPETKTRHRVWSCCS